MFHRLRNADRLKLGTAVEGSLANSLQTLRQRHFLKTRTTQESHTTNLLDICRYSVLCAKSVGVCDEACLLFVHQNTVGSAIKSIVFLYLEGR